MKYIFCLLIAILFFTFPCFSNKFSVISDNLKEPSYISKNPLYAKLLLLNNEELLLAFDESKGTGKGYDILYADTNYNNNLADDLKIKKVISLMQNYEDGYYEVFCNNSDNNVGYQFLIRRHINGIWSISVKVIIEDKRNEFVYRTSVSIKSETDYKKVKIYKIKNTELGIKTYVYRNNLKIETGCFVNRKQVDFDCLIKNGEIIVPFIKIFNNNKLINGAKMKSMPLGCDFSKYCFNMKIPDSVKNSKLIIQINYDGGCLLLNGLRKEKEIYIE